MKNDKVFQIIVFQESLLENDNEHEVFVNLVLMPLVNQWLKTHEGVCPSA